MYTKTGWCLIEEGHWAHVKGTVVRERRKRHGEKVYWWVATPVDREERLVRKLKDAKAYVDGTSDENNGTGSRELQEDP